MANNNQKKSNTASSKNNSNYSTSDIKKKYTEHERRQQLFQAAQDVVNLLDISKNETRTYTIYSKSNLRTYMQNPKSNEANLRNLSRFLYRVSQPYRRLINYNAQMMDLSALTITPLIDLTQENDKETIIKQYYDTCVEVEKINLAKEIYKCLVIAWREDCFYGYVYEDDSGFFIMPLDGDYCKVSSINYDGTLNFAFDFSYFKRRQELLEYWDKEFTTKYNKYDSDSSLRWQELDPERTICLKVNIDDPTLSIAPYVALFEAIIDNVDLQSIQAVKNELSIYKLLVARLKTLSGTNDPDDFEVDPDTALKYYEKFEESLPDCVAAALSPLEIEPIEFKGTTTDETDMLSASMSNLFKLSGGSLVLNDEHTGATIFNAHIISDMLNALTPLLGQVEAWINRYLSYVLTNPAKVNYLKVSPYTKAEKKKELIESAQYGVPVKMAVAALDGFSPLETLSMQFLENDCLGLHDNWIPLQSSYTQSGSGDTNEKDITELTDEGDSSREEEKNEM